MQSYSTKKIEPKTSRKSIQPLHKTKRFNYLSNYKTVIMHNNNKIIDRNIDQLERGKVYYKQNNLKMAIQCFNSASLRDENNIQINYMLGVCYLSLNKFQLSIANFKKVLAQNPTYKKNIFLLISIGYKKQNQLDQAVKIITEAFNYFQDYLDAFVYRAKLYMKTKKYELALEDLSKALKIQPMNMVANQAIADCHKMNNSPKEAIQHYSICLSLEANNYVILQKRATSYYQIRQFKLAEIDFDTLISNKIVGSEIYYFKGMIALKSNKQSEASLYFQQAITDNSSIKAVTKSIQELTILRIKGRDFYSAYQVLKRSQFIQTQRGFIQRLMKFVQGVTFLMKRKFQEADQNFKQICEQWCENPKKNYQFLVPVFYLYRAYGYFCLSNHKLALQNYNLIEDQQFLREVGYRYNKLICQGIELDLNGKKQESIFKFKDALKVAERMEPYFYIGVTLIQQSLELETSDNILKALQILTQGLQIQQASNLYYYRSLVYLFLSMNAQAIQDIDKAIEKSEDNVPKYFYIRGLIFAIQGNYKQAISDLSTCISLDQQFHEAYLQRAKCYILENQITLAYNDLETYPNNKRWIALFFIHSCQYDQALQLIEPDDQELYEILHLRLGYWNESGVSGKLCSAVANRNKDIEPLIDSAIESGIGIGYFQTCDLLLLKGFMTFQIDVVEAIQYFKKALILVSNSITQDTNLQEQQYHDLKIVQIKFNIIMGFLEKGQKVEAITLLNNMKQDLIYSDLKQKIEDLIEHVKGEKQISQIQFFNYNDLLSKHLPYFTLSSAKIKFKILIPFPLLPFPTISCTFNVDILRNFTVTSVDNKPEAPWIKRTLQGIFFTDEIQVFQHLKLQTSMCEQAEIGDHQETEGAEEQTQQRRIQKLKQHLKLDTKIEEKLNKLALIK